MKLGHFIFVNSWDPAEDSNRIADTLAMAKLTEEVGLDAVWLAEHHFSGQCLYAEPLTMASAIAAVTERVEIGIAVVQASLRNPIRLAEQISLVDNLSKGRLITGLSYGTRFALYEWAAYGVEAEKARDRLNEVEEVMLKAWAQPSDGSGEWPHHKGRWFDLRIPSIRPAPYTRPRPRLIHASTTEESTKALAARGETFLMHMVSPEDAERQVGWYREGARAAGRSEAEIAALLKQVWTWRQCYVADTDKAAEAGLAYHRRLFMELIGRMGELNERLGLPRRQMSEEDAAKLSPRLFHGSPETVARSIEHLEGLGLGGVFLEFQFGGMSRELGQENLRRFAREVAPRFRQKALEPA